MSKAVPEPTVIQPISMNSWTALATRPAATKIRATPVQLKNVLRLMSLAPR